MSDLRAHAGPASTPAISRAESSLDTTEARDGSGIAIVPALTSSPSYDCSASPWVFER